MPVSQLSTSLKLKATAFISVMILGVGFLLCWYFLSSSDRVLREQLQQRALALGNNLAHNSRYGLLTEDPVILDRLIEGILQEENVVFAAIINESGDILADRFRDAGKDESAPEADHARALVASVTIADEAIIQFIDEGSQSVHPTSGIYHVSAPVVQASEPESAQENELAQALAMFGESSPEPQASGPLGSVQIIVSLEQLEHNISTAIRAGVGITLAIIVVGIAIAFLFVRYVLTPVQAMADASTHIAAGDLSQRVEARSADEIGLLAGTFNDLTDALSRIIGQAQRSGSQISSSATEIATAGKQLEATVNQQAASTNEVVATAKEISSTSQELVSTMGEVSAKADETVSSADTGRQGLVRMESTMEQMEEATVSIASRLGVINEKASDISSVVVTITKVADQTNLLSLNAAIEAEKAGEYGVGFAVVAREIRRLADQTAVATLDIEQTVKVMLAAVSAGVMSMDKFNEQVRQGAEEIRGVGSQLAGIIEQVHALTPRFESVDKGMQAQSQGAVQISESMTQLSDGAHQTVSSLREINHVLDQLRGAANDMQTEIARFKLT